MKKRLLSLASVVLILFILSGCESKISNKSLQKMLKSDSDFTDLDPDSSKAVSEIDIAKGTKALLFSAKAVDGGNTSYYIAAVNTKDKDLSPVSIVYTPLELMQEEICKNRPQNMNIAYFEKMSDYLKTNGINYFTNEKNAVEFLREITGDGGIIATGTAQSALESTIKADSIYNDGDEFWVVFEENNANPLCYAIKSKSNYDPESDDDDIWVAYTLDGSKDGEYKTKSELYEAVTGKYAEFGEDVAETQGVLRFATVSDKAPFAYINDGELTGADIDIAKAIAQELNMDIDISTMSSAAAISGTASGSFDMAMAAFTASVEYDDVTFTDNYYDDYVIILNRDNEEINNKICVALATLNRNGTTLNLIEKHNAGKVSDEEEAPEKKTADESEKSVSSKDTEKDDNTNISATDKENETPTSTISYRVRKSADDYKSQTGAFASLENAKKEANAHKDEGYKVYDMNGKLIYTP